MLSSICIAMLYDIRRRAFLSESSEYGRQPRAKYRQAVFSEGAQLKMEFDELYNALFTNADTYISVVRLLSENKSGMTRKDMAAESVTTYSGLRISIRCSITSSLNPTTPKMTDGGATTWILVVCPHGWG